MISLIARLEKATRSDRDYDLIWLTENGELIAAGNNGRAVAISIAAMKARAGKE